MSDDLDSDDILRAIEAPSSEFDPNMDGVSDDGWGSNVNSEMGDTDEDPDFLPSDDSVPGSESDDNEVGKISPLIDRLNDSFKMKKTPGEDVVIDESMIPFRGRLLFRQYLPNKTHKYGIKVLKICDTTGYTYKMKVYMGAGTGTEDNLTLAASVVMDLMRDYLDKGHTLYVDNFYTSVDLAHMLLARNTHLVGSVISNRSWFPSQKTIPGNSDDQLNLKKGQMSCLEHPSGIVYTKWFDKREVKMMSTKHPADYVDTGKKKTRQGEPILKPLVVFEYNKAKMGIDVSDQMSSYSTAIRKSMRWYHKVAEEFLLGTAVVNAWLAYKDAAVVNSQSTQFGTVVTLFVAGYLTAGPWGWPSIFYSTGLCGVLWAVAWLFLGANSPDTHPSISDSEREYIKAAFVSSSDQSSVTWEVKSGNCTYSQACNNVPRTTLRSDTIEGITIV
ncbi:piggyBac transposable element-derived protein 4-like [Homalodisca vitripennis]|uniref:piggyBac transposable element-derived protein 4-like n=1 Tax=Homalodisca vitripennis TaxID=197043 RepID=UPI001EEADA59|nr:piggyBac transposable element-derived protein 4-like [Homalodisca vitripennis]